MREERDEDIKRVHEMRVEGWCKAQMEKYEEGSSLLFPQQRGCSGSLIELDVRQAPTTSTG